MTESNHSKTPPASTKVSNTKLLKKLGMVVVAMFGFGYLMVPIYDVFCEITGLNGKPSNEVAIAPVLLDKSRLVTVEFDATLNEYLPWEFKPQTHKVKVHPGELTTVYYKVTNRTKNDMVGQAVPSVVPSKAAEHMKKTECFCFTQQKLAAGETRDMPVTFYVDPKIQKNVNIMSLSYTFFDASKVAQN